MKSKLLLLCIVSAICFATFTVSAQDQARTITVTGTYMHNLSPNEIIIKIAYQEYFTADSESADSKIPIEKIEKKVIQSLKAAGAKDEKITFGAASLYRPRDSKTNSYKKRRLKKELFLCISNTDEYIQLIRQLEQDNLFDKEVTSFNITDYKHTEKKKYITKSHALALADAKSKAALILSGTDQKVGKAITIEEADPNRNNSFNPNTYGFDNSPEEKISGFSSIVIKYELKVVFEIL